MHHDKHHKMMEVAKILETVLCEFIETHKEWSQPQTMDGRHYPKGLLCPHTGNPKAHDKFDEIIEDVQQAHDVLEIAMKLAGKSWEDMHGHYDHDHQEKAALPTPGNPARKLT